MPPNVLRAAAHSSSRASVSRKGTSSSSSCRPRGHAVRRRGFSWCLFSAAASRRRHDAPSIVLSRWPVSPSARRAYLRARVRSPRARILRLACSGIFLGACRALHAVWCLRRACRSPWAASSRLKRKMVHARALANLQWICHARVRVCADGAHARLAEWTPGSRQERPGGWPRRRKQFPFAGKNLPRRFAQSSRQARTRSVRSASRSAAMSPIGAPHAYVPMIQ